MSDQPEAQADIDWPTLLTKAVGDIAALLILMGDEDKISAWTADYCAAINRADSISTPAQPEASELVEAVRQSQKVFAEYAELHRRKLSGALTLTARSDVMAKIERNRYMSDLCLAALASHRALD